MHFRSSLVPYKTCTTDALDKEETYYYVLSTDAATMYRVKYSDGNWYYIDDSKEGLGEKLTDNKERFVLSLEGKPFLPEEESFAFPIVP